MYDLVILGTDKHGLQAAQYAARCGLWVALVEEASQWTESFYNSPEEWCQSLELSLNEQIANYRTEQIRWLRELGVEVLSGTARFVRSPSRSHSSALSLSRRSQTQTSHSHSVVVQTEEQIKLVQGKRFLIATGTSPRPPANSNALGIQTPMQNEPHGDSPSIDTVLILGESENERNRAFWYAQNEKEVYWLSHESASIPDCNKPFIKNRFHKNDFGEAGDRIHTLRYRSILKVAEQLETSSHCCTVTWMSPQGRYQGSLKSLTADLCLDYRNRAGRTDSLALDLVGLYVDDHKRIWCDEKLQTWEPRIFAIGDVVGFPLELPVRNPAKHVIYQIVREKIALRHQNEILSYHFAA